MSQYFYSFLSSRLSKLKRNQNYEMIVLGLSYSLYGIVENQMSKNCIKLALPSQDLYYDHVILRSVLESKGKIKYCILGMAYYSFDLDLRFSEKFRIWDTYYPIFNDSHKLDVPENYPVPKTTMDKFKELRNNFIHGFITPDFREKSWNRGGILVNGPIEAMDENSRILKVQERIRTHNKSNYPQTRKEHEEIFANTLMLLSENDIKPIIVIFPTTKYYSALFNIEIINRFYTIINNLKKEYDFQFIDMFRDTRFELNDFLDWDHLNKTGATKMSKYLNEAIIW